MSGPDKVDRLLHEWEDVASTAKPPSRDPRRSSTTAGAFPASMLLMAAIAIAVVAIVGRGATNPQVAATPNPGSIAVGSADPSTPAPEPSATPFAADGIDEDDRFRLELTTDGTTYAEGDAIDAIAAVTFLGPEGEVVGSAEFQGPVWFSVMELGGSGRRAGFTDLYVGTLVPTCEEATYPRSEPVEYPWVKGGSSATAFDEAFWEQYLISVGDQADPKLRLPAGRWVLTARFGASEGACGSEGPGHSLRADVIVDVAVSGPSASPEPLDPALTDRGVADDGRFRVELTTNGATFQEGETIQAGAEVTFLGPEGSLATGHGSPAVTFAVEEIGGAHRSAEGGYDAMCLRSTFTRDEAVLYPWQRGGSWSSDDPSPNDRFTESYVEGWSEAGEGELQLPAGTWRLSAELDVDEGDCGGPGEPRTVSIVIRVDPAPSSATPEPEPPVLEVGPIVICDRVSPEDCEHAVALVREQFDGGRDIYPGADFVLVADTCTPGAICDRQYPFEATVMYALWGSRGGTGEPTLQFLTNSASTVYGMVGAEEVRAGDGFVAPWMPERISAASDLIPVPTFPPQLPNEPRECPAALITGTLEEMATYGMGLKVDGEALPVRWPFGFSTRRDEGQLVLLDAAGEVVGGHGDPVQAGGGIGTDSVMACGGVNRTPAPQTP